MPSAPLLDRAGRRRSPATTASFDEGRAPSNKGLRYPPDPPSVEEIVAVGDPDGGTKPRTARKVRAGSRVSPALTDLAARLSDRLETRVRVDLGKERGKIVIEFANMKDLQRIVAALMPGDGDGDLDDAA